MASKGTKRPRELRSISQYRRIVVKAGTNLLTGGTGHLDKGVMNSLVSQIAYLCDQGVEVLLVSSGAVAAGRQVLDTGQDGGKESQIGKLKIAQKSSTTPWSWELPFRQVLAAVGQSRLMYTYERLFAEYGVSVAQALVSRRDIADRLGYLNIRNTLLALLSLGVIPILNENDVVSIEELSGEVIGDNDTLSALVANMVDAELLVMLGEVAGLYTADPRIHPEAQFIPLVEHLEDLDADAAGSWDGLGRGGMVTKLAAARLATASGIATSIVDGREPDVLIRLASGQAIGTRFSPTAGQLESRQRWMLSAVSSHDAIVADEGAVQALIKKKRSLLPAGIKNVEGKFQRAQLVEIRDLTGQRIAVGIANYEAEDVRRIMGVRSDRIEAVLGYEYGAEVVHRSNMVVLSEGSSESGFAKDIGAG